MTAAVLPGSFDPPTVGHLDVIRRAAALFAPLTVAVVSNPSKSALLPADERIALLAAELSDLDVEVVATEGLLVDLCVARGIGVIVKGVRGPADVDLEVRMARMNRHLAGVETVLVPGDPAHAHVASSLVKEIARLGGSLEGLVPAAVAAAVAARLA